MGIFIISMLLVFIAVPALMSILNDMFNELTETPSILRVSIYALISIGTAYVYFTNY